MTSTEPRTLVLGATGHVGSQIVKTLLRKGRPVRALVRKPNAKIHGADGTGDLDYAVGDLADRESLRRALRGVDVVVSTANGIIPSGRTMSVKSINRDGHDALIEEAERAGVSQFVQSSVPTWEKEHTVPELAGKRALEARLAASSIPATIVRNPAFMDVWLVMAGCRQLIGPDPHATTRRPFGFMRMWQAMTGNLVARHGLLLAPGGANHGAPFIATRDVAEIMAGAVGRDDCLNHTIEAGGPEWVTWREVAEKLSRKVGHKVRPVPMKAWFAATGQTAMVPFMPSAANVLGLVKLVAAHQPRWGNPPIVQELNLPEQITLDRYIEQNWSAD